MQTAGVNAFSFYGAQWALYAVGVVGAAVAVILGGGGAGAQSNLLAALNPRFTLDHPTLLFMQACVLAVVALYAAQMSVNARWLTALCAAAFAVPFVCALVVPETAFGDGRYSSRTLVAGFMLGLAQVFAYRQGLFGPARAGGGAQRPGGGAGIDTGRVHSFCLWAGPAADGGRAAAPVPRRPSLTGLKALQRCSRRREGSRGRRRVGETRRS